MKVSGHNRCSSRSRFVCEIGSAEKPCLNCSIWCQMNSSMLTLSVGLKRNCAASGIVFCSRFLLFLIALRSHFRFIRREPLSVFTFLFFFFCRHKAGCVGPVLVYKFDLRISRWLLSFSWGYVKTCFYLSECHIRCNIWDKRANSQNHRSLYLSRAAASVIYIKAHHRPFLAWETRYFLF